MRFARSADGAMPESTTATVTPAPDGVSRGRPSVARSDAGAVTAGSAPPGARATAAGGNEGASGGQGSTAGGVALTRATAAPTPGSVPSSVEPRPATRPVTAPSCPPAAETMTCCAWLPLLCDHWRSAASSFGDVASDETGQLTVETTDTSGAVARDTR